MGKHKKSNDFSAGDLKTYQAKKPGKTVRDVKHNVNSIRNSSLEKKEKSRHASNEIDDLFDTVKKQDASGIIISSKQKKCTSIKHNASASIPLAGPSSSSMTNNYNAPYNEQRNDMLYGVMKSNLQSKSIISPEAPVHRYDEESGLPVYKAHLLKVGEGGGTALCPFDCDCCF